jgi:hypothetical protein
MRGRDGSFLFVAFFVITLSIHYVLLYGLNIPIHVEAQSSNSFTWHDDCSNISGWEPGTEWNYDTPWTISNGSIFSESGSLQSEMDGEYSGPFWFKTLDKQGFTNGFHKLTIEVEISTKHLSGKSLAQGGFGLVLYDSGHKPIFSIVIEDWSSSSPDFTITASHEKADGSIKAERISGLSDLNPIHDSISIYNTTSGDHNITFSDLPQETFSKSSDWINEPLREIKYIGIQWVQESSFAPLIVRLHDIIYIGGGSAPQTPDILLVLLPWFLLIGCISLIGVAIAFGILRIAKKGVGLEDWELLPEFGIYVSHPSTSIQSSQKITKLIDKSDSEIFNELELVLEQSGYAIQKLDSGIHKIYRNQFACLLKILRRRLDVEKSKLITEIQLDDEISHGIIIAKDRNTSQVLREDKYRILIIGGTKYVEQILIWLNEQSNA